VENSGYMGLRGYVLRRSAYTVVLLFFVITLNFFIFEVMPGSPLDVLANPQYLRNPDQLDEAIRLFGLDKGPVERYFIYAKNMLTFNFGYAYGVGTISNTLVSAQIASRLTNTLLLIGLSSIISIVVGIFLGVYAAARRGGIFDSLQVTSSLVWGSLPTFWIGLVFILIFSQYLDWLPSAHTQPDSWGINPPELGTLFAPNWAGVGEFISGRLRHLILPVAVLSLFQYGGFLLLTRATMMESLTEDYVLTARPKERLAPAHNLHRSDCRLHIHRGDNYRNSLCLSRVRTLDLRRHQHQRLSFNAGDILHNRTDGDHRQLHRRPFTRHS